MVHATFYSQGGLRFHRQALENHLQQTYRMAPGSYNMPYPLVASIDPVFCLTWVSNTGLRSVQPIILPHPDWFLQRMAKPSIDTANTRNIPNFFQ